MKPCLKWVGGKAYLSSHILEVLPKNRNKYIEPFLGGGALPFIGNLHNSILSDKNSQLISFYKHIKDNPESLMSEVDIIDKECTPEYYQQIRNEYNANILTDFTCKQSAKFLFLNKYCFNGLYRVNKHNQYNVPKGDKTRVKLYDRANIMEISNYFNNSDSQLLCCDYSTTCILAQEGDVVYLDPPYAPISATSKFVDYDKNGFSFAEQERLFLTMEKLKNKGCYVIMNNSDCPYIRDRYSNYEIKTLQALRSVNADGSNRTGVDLLIANFRI